MIEPNEKSTREAVRPGTAPPADECRLDALIALITPENIPDPVDWGAPVGKEVW